MKDEPVEIRYCHVERCKFEAGDKRAIMRAMYTCADLDIPMPAWLSRAFVDACNQVFSYQAKSWDEVFGVPHPKGKHLAAMRKKRDKSLEAWVAVLRDHELHGKPIGEALFAEVGKELALGKTLVAEFYYEHQKRRRGRRLSKEEVAEFVKVIEDMNKRKQT